MPRTEPGVRSRLVVFSALATQLPGCQQAPEPARIASSVRMWARMQC